MDERLSKIEDEKRQALEQSNNTYGEMLQNNQDLYNQQNAYADEFERSQNDVLDKQLAHQEELINQQKEKARQNMEAEQKRAKNDYTSYVNPYGLQAESFASRGLLNSGVSETAKLGGYNTYQNRLASANKVMQDAFVQYDNDMNEARLNNDVQKAENALKKLEMQLQYSENYYNQKNTLTQNQLANNQALDSEYYSRYNTEYNNIQEEQARQEAIRQWEAEMQEKQRQYNENLAYQREQARVQQEQFAQQLAYQQEQARQAQANWEKEYALSQQKAASSGSGYSGSGYGGYSLSNGSSQSGGESLTGQGNQNSSAKKISARMSVAKNGFTDAGYSWYLKNFPDQMTEDEIEAKLVEGVQKGMIPQNKVSIILRRYGL